MLSKSLKFIHAPLRSNVASISDASAEKRVNFMAVAWGINTMAFSIIFPFLPIYLHTTRGIPMSRVGVIFLVMGLANIAGSPISGFLTDRLGRRPVMISGPLLRSLTFFLLSLMAAIDAGFWLFAFGLFCSTFFGTFFQNGANAYITDLIHPDDCNVAFSKIRVGLNIGWMIGPATGAFLSKTPFSYFFLLTAGFCTVTATIVYKFCVAVPTKKHPTSPGARKESYLAILKNDPVFLAYLALFSLFFLSVSHFVPTLSIFATKVVNIEQSQLGLLFTINGALVIVLMIPVNNWLKNTNILYRISIGSLIYVLAYVIFGYSTNWYHLIVGMVVLTLAEILSLTATVTVTGLLAPKDSIGRYMGLWGLSDGVARAVGPYFGALAFDYYSGQSVLLWLTLSSTAIISALGLFILGSPRMSMMTGKYHIQTALVSRTQA